MDTTDWTYGAPYLQDDEELTETEKELLECENKLNFLKKKARRYFELAGSPFTITSDEQVEINNIKKIFI